MRRHAGAVVSAPLDMYLHVCHCIYMPTMPRSLRIPDELWHAAVAKAREKGTTVTDVVRRALEQFVKGH